MNYVFINTKYVKEYLYVNSYQVFMNIKLLLRNGILKHNNNKVIIITMLMISYDATLTPLLC